jgi:hypothetical protein
VIHSVLARNTIVETAGSGPREGHHGDPLVHGKDRGLSTKLPNWELGPRGNLCEGLQQKLGGSTSFSRPREESPSSTGVYILYHLCFRIYIMYLGCVLTA